MTYNNDINANVTGLVKGDGSGGFTGVTVTQYNSLIGSTSNGITSVAPGSTTGVPLVSQGASANPSYTTMVVGGGGTGVTSATAYGVICAGTTSTGAFQVVTPGASAKILQANGASALPTWVTAPSGGNLVLIQSQSPSGAATVSFTSGITATYNNYILLGTNISSSSGSTTIITLQISTNGGSSYISSGYYSGNAQVPYNSTTASGTASNTTGNMLTYPGPTTTIFNSFVVYLFDLTAGSGYPMLSAKGTASTTSTANYSMSMGAYNTASTTVNAFQLALDVGNVTGTFTLLGILE